MEPVEVPGRPSQEIKDVLESREKLTHLFPQRKEPKCEGPGEASVG